jgi:hypothetical protein
VFGQSGDGAIELGERVVHPLGQLARRQAPFAGIELDATLSKASRNRSLASAADADAHAQAGERAGDHAVTLEVGGERDGVVARRQPHEVGPGVGHAPAALAQRLDHPATLAVDDPHPLVHLVDRPRLASAARWPSALTANGTSVRSIAAMTSG